MAFPFLPLIAGAAVGSLTTYLMKNKKKKEAKDKKLVETIATDETPAEPEKSDSDLN